MTSSRRHLSQAANTMVPAILALEAMGYTVTDKSSPGNMWTTAVRGDESFGAEDFVGLLGMVKLVELRGWDCFAEDDEILDAEVRMGWGQ